ncbi:cytochrome P450 [Microlunatus soli]|uniref:Cytochrome P450 n=1 Tax=Microlunatus soli TaxID=630515 RepID=A0A1H1VUW1_9ACTN|nr:cytochrome P450 [Microlunatus soli]SDS88250.1 Cytochrome P450 [Microlunatus soli]
MLVADFDLTEPRTFHRRDLSEHWRRQRAERPVFWHPARGTGSQAGKGAFCDTGFWVVTRYDDVVDLYRAGDAVTSENGNVLDTLLSGGDSASRKMLAVTDGARHRTIRKKLVRSFTPRALAELTERIRNRTVAVVDEALTAADGDSIDVATRIADRLPIEAICDLMDVPAADRPQLLSWNKAALSADEADTEAFESLIARQEILYYFAELCERRRRSPGLDVVSALAQVEVDGVPLAEDELALNCYSLILGGDESSRMSAITGIRAFADHPEQWQTLRAAPSVDRGIEEILRWSTPSMHFARTAVRPIRVGSEVIEPGQIITLWNSSADFDETVFAEPDVFDVTRHPNPHLAFGHGQHFCLGAFLARTELRALFGELRRRVSRIELAGEPKRVYSNFLFGYSSLPVRFSR